MRRRKQRKAFPRADVAVKVSAPREGARPTGGADQHSPPDIRHSKLPGPCLVMLGRYGDIINLLPVCKKMADAGVKPHVAVSREFASVLDGVSYVTPEPMDLEYGKLQEGLALARERFDHVLSAQVHGPMYESPQRERAYNVDSWRLAGRLEQFNDTEGMPLVFDRRSAKREQALRDRLLERGKPVILLNLSGGHSSPLDGWKAAQLEIIRRWAPYFQIVDLATVKAERIYDLLGLMDAAEFLITTDTATLHLAAASRVRTIALVNEAQWLGTEPRCRCALRMRYNEIDYRMGEIHRMLAEEVCSGTRRRTGSGPRIWHAVERHAEPSPEEMRRKKRAWNSWETLYRAGLAVPCHYWAYRRNATEIGDRRELPFLKDVLDAARQRANPGDIILLTNDDNVLHPLLPEALHRQIAMFGACTGHRSEFHQWEMPDVEEMRPDAIGRAGEPHMGRDLAAFSVEWLDRNWDKIPDFILGAPDWDLCLAAMVRVMKGFPVENGNFEDVIPQCELPKGHVLHKWHEAKWTDPAETETAPANAHNRRLFREWAKTNAPGLRFNGFNALVRAVP